MPLWENLYLIFYLFNKELVKGLPFHNTSCSEGKIRLEENPLEARDTSKNKKLRLKPICDRTALLGFYFSRFSQGMDMPALWDIAVNEGSLMSKMDI